MKILDIRKSEARRRSVISSSGCSTSNFHSAKYVGSVINSVSASSSEYCLITRNESCECVSCSYTSSCVGAEFWTSYISSSLMCLTRMYSKITMLKHAVMCGTRTNCSQIFGGVLGVPLFMFNVYKKNFVCEEDYSKSKVARCYYFTCLYSQSYLSYHKKYAMFTHDISKSGTLAYVLPTIKSASSICVKYVVQTEAVEFYREIEEFSPLIVAGGILANYEKAMALKRALKRFAALGYTEIPREADKIIKRYKERIYNNLLTIAEYNKKIKNCIYGIVFNIPGIYESTGTVIRRVATASALSFIYTKYVKDLIYFNLVIYKGLTPEMFSKGFRDISYYVSKLLSVAESQFSVVGDYISRLEEGSTISDKIVKSYLKSKEVLIRFRYFGKSPAFGIVKVYITPFDVSTFLSSVIDYSKNLHRAFVAAAASIAMFSLFGRVVYQKYYYHFIEAFRYMRMIDELLSKKEYDIGKLTSALVNKAISSSEMPEISSLVAMSSFSIYSSMYFDTIDAQIIYDPSKSVFAPMSNVLKRFIKFSLGANLALLDAIDIVGGLTGEDKSILRDILETLIEVEPDRKSLIGEVISYALPKEVSDIINEIRTSQYYVMYMSAFLDKILLLSAVAPLVDNIAKASYKLIKCVKRTGILGVGACLNVVGELAGLRLDLIGNISRKMLSFRDRVIKYIRECQKGLSQCSFIPVDILYDDNMWSFYKEYCKKIK